MSKSGGKITAAAASRIQALPGSTPKSVSVQVFEHAESFDPALALFSIQEPANGGRGAVARLDDAWRVSVVPG